MNTFWQFMKRNYKIILLVTVISAVLWSFMPSTKKVKDPEKDKLLLELLSFILENDFNAKEVLDMGCGTGILAILASKRGAKQLLAVDYDPICVDSVIENVQLNDVDNIAAKLGSKEAIEGLTFDTILANINRNILLDQLETYSTCLANGGELYLSGFYDGEDLEILKQKADSVGFQYVENKVLDNWCAAKFTKAI